MLLEVACERFLAHWGKLCAVRRALAHYDWVLWIDYDALFVNVTQARQSRPA